MKTDSYLNNMKSINIYNEDFIKKIEFEYNLDNDFDIIQDDIRIISDLLLKLTIVEYPQIEDQDLISKNIIFELLDNTKNINNSFYKYKSSIQNKYENIIYDEDNLYNMNNNKNRKSIIVDKIDSNLLLNKMKIS